MGRNRNKRGGVAGGGRVKMERPLDSIIRGIVVYMEISKAARNELIRQKCLPVGIGIRLEIESQFCMNLLENMCHLKRSYIQDLQREVTVDKKKFEEEVLAFIDAVVPKKKRIIQSQNIRQELAALTRRDKGAKGGRVII